MVVVKSCIPEEAPGDLPRSGPGEGLDFSAASRCCFSNIARRFLTALMVAVFEKDRLGKWQAARSKLVSRRESATQES